ncbi:EKC/KEOPS complex subunit TPRKB [Petromyzon marinus]|uniref:EKC/KEOPS complex subunit TPRKB n=1 Tax=Petromyzon marinus TaxID=7757 RepID=UPI003F6F8C0B
MTLVVAEKDQIEARVEERLGGMGLEGPQGGEGPDCWPLERLPGWRVSLLLFRAVQNAAELRLKAMSGALPGAVISAAVVLDPFQVLVAAHKAVHLHRLGKLKTKALHSEVIYNLSPSNNISDAFRRFGVADGDTAVLVVLVEEEGAERVDPASVEAHVNGQRVPAGELSALADLARVRKTYKVAAEEERLGTLLDAVVFRMAAKEAQ